MAREGNADFVCICCSNLLLAKNNSEIKELNTRVTEQNKCDELEQYSRRNVIRIRGIPEKAGEETDAVIRELVEKKLGVKIAAHDIVRSHRVGRKGEVILTLKRN